MMTCKAELTFSWAERSYPFSCGNARKYFLFGFAIILIWLIVSGKWIEFPSTYLNVKDNVSIQFKSRQLVLKDQCKNSTNKLAIREVLELKSRLFVYKDVTYCAIPKVGSTTWKKLLMLMSNKCKNCSRIRDIKNVHSKINYLWDNYQLNDINNVLNRSRKMIIVREPFSRLLSAYVNKVFVPVTLAFWHSTWQFVERNRPFPMGKCVDFTFPEIVRYVIKASKMKTLKNQHFNTMSEICKPCKVQYDTIIKMETFNRDTIYLLNTLNKSNVYNDTSTLIHESMESSIINHINDIYKSNVGVCQSKAEKIRRLWRSFQIRGFIGNGVKYPLSKENEKYIDHDELIKIVLKETKMGKHSDQRENKILALIEAYSKIPFKDMEELSEIFKQDCDIFGYDCRPEILFNRVKFPPVSNFFDIWSV